MKKAYNVQNVHIKKAFLSYGLQSQSQKLCVQKNKSFQEIK